MDRCADRVTVADIAAAADISPRTYFNYFSSREEALVADDLDRGRHFVELVTASPACSEVWPELRAANWMQETSPTAPTPSPGSRSATSSFRRKTAPGPPAGSHELLCAACASTRPDRAGEAQAA